MLRHAFYEKDEMSIPERKWINLKEYYDVEYWSKKFNIKPELLQRAVIESGSTTPVDVETYIKNKYPF